MWRWLAPAALVAAAGATTAVVVSTDSVCDHVDFAAFRGGDDAVAWRIRHCGAVHGLPRARVRELLGSPDQPGRSDDTWTLEPGTEYGDTQYMVVRYGPDARVRRVRILPL